MARSVRSPCSLKTRTTAAATGTHSAGVSSSPQSREILVPGDSAEFQAKIDSRGHSFTGRQRLFLFHAHRHEADIVGVGERGDAAAAVEGDVELPR